MTAMHRALALTAALVALADYDRALSLSPKLAGSLWGRGVGKQKKGDSAGAEADFAAAKAIKADIADEWARYDVR